MYSIEYTLYVSNSAKEINRVREFNSLEHMLNFLELWEEPGLDYITIHRIFCGERVLPKNLIRLPKNLIRKLYACA